MIVCSKCGAQLPDGNKFCGNCGNAIIQAGNTAQDNPAKPIRPIVCELCGGNSLTKENGFFVCQNCGTRYSLEEARKMMIEGTVQVAGTVTVDNSGKIGNYLMMAGSAFNVENYKEAEEYANKVIEIDPQNAEAWFIKGKAAGYQSTLGKIRLSESVQCWVNTIIYSGNDRQKFQSAVSNEISKLEDAIILLKAETFAESPTESNMRDLLDARSLLDINRDIQTKTQIPFDEKAWRETLAKSMHNAAIRGYKTANAYFGTLISDRLTHKYQTWLDYVDNCINLLFSAMKLSETKYTLIHCLDNAISMEKNIVSSRSYKFNGVAYIPDKTPTQSSISYRKKLIKELTTRKSKILRDKNLP